jgi:hypothetical protein
MTPMGKGVITPQAAFLQQRRPDFCNNVPRRPPKTAIPLPSSLTRTRSLSVRQHDPPKPGPSETTVRAALEEAAARTRADGRHRFIAFDRASRSVVVVLWSHDEREGLAILADIWTA